MNIIVNLYNPLAITLSKNICITVYTIIKN